MSEEAAPYGSGAQPAAAPAPHPLPAGEAERRVGGPYTLAQGVGTLGAIGCTVDADDAAATGVVVVTPPSWRPDLTEPAELVEEVARLVGYDEIPSVLPSAPGGRGLTREQRVRRSVARALAEHGFVATLSYPWL